MDKTILVGVTGTYEDSVATLSRALFRGELTRDQIRSLPSQTLFFAIKHLGLESAGDVLEFISTKQYSALLDFEFWTKDSFREDRFWDWIDSIDDMNNLLPIQKFLSSIDPTLLAYIIRRYTEVVYHEEPDDYPPGPNFYTPDQGRTWICIKTHDPERHRIFGKLLAFIFQTQTEYFYRLLMQASEGTSIEFEEIGYNQKSQRLQEENIPAFEETEPIHRSLTAKEFFINNKFDENISVNQEDDEFSVRKTLSFSGIRYQPLLASLEEVSEQRLSEIQDEFARILNSAMVFFLNDFGEESRVKLLTKQVFGIINLGLQMLSKENPNIVTKNYVNQVKFSEIYRVGISAIYELRKMAYKIPQDICDTLTHMNEPLSILVECLRNPLPSVPSFFREDGTFEITENRIIKEELPITSIQQIDSIKKILSTQIIEKSKEIRSYETSGMKHAISSNDNFGEPQ